MTTLDDKLVPKTVALIEKYGKLVTVHDKPNTPDPTTGRTTGTPASRTLKATPPSPAASRFIDGDIVRVGDVSMLVAGGGLSYTPEVGQRIVFNDDSYRVVKVERIFSGDLVAAWKYFARS